MTTFVPPNLTPQQPNYAQPNYNIQWLQTQVGFNGVSENLTSLQTQITGIVTFPGIGTNIRPVGSTNSAGSDTVVAADDHQHQGVHEITIGGNNLVGDITFHGSSARQVGMHSIYFQPFGEPTEQPLPYTYTAGDGYVILTPSAGNQAFTMPATAGFANGDSIVIRNASVALTITITASGTDLFNGTLNVFNMGTLGNAFSGAIFTQQGGNWWTIATVG